MIPKNIWQTYKTSYENLPEYAMKATATWIEKNPDWKYEYFSDSDVMDFVKDNFGNEWIKIFESCPIGVMRADIWRVMIVYVYGGMYTDLDTICHVPISLWFDKIPDKRIILNAEHEIHIQQWTFLAEASHPVLEHILYNIEKAFGNPDYTNEHFVHAMTGPGIFTKSVLEFLNMWHPSSDIDGEVYKLDDWAKFNGHKVNLIKDVDEINSSSLAQDYGLYITPSFRFFHNEVSEHLYGSQIWDDGRYDQWIVERKKLI